VPFSGWGESSPALLGGHIEALVAQPGEVRPLVEAKRMRVLAVFQPVRNPIFADVPTFKELGYPVHNGSTFFLVVPNGTPPDVVRYLHDSAKAAIDDPAFVSFAKARVIDVDYRAGDKLRADLWNEYRMHTEILKRLGMLRK
jgi:tripartite-type tricarboxylate transporter receptor subunit TctC